MHDFRGVSAGAGSRIGKALLVCGLSICCGACADDAEPPVADRALVLQQPAPTQDPTPPAAATPKQEPSHTPGQGWLPAPAWVRDKNDHPEDVGPLIDAPYLRGVKQAPDRISVTVYDGDRAQEGINLVVSAHAPEASLLDMKGNVLHTWHYEFDQVWPGPLGFKAWGVHKTFWRRAHLYPNGDLLAVFEGVGMIKIDAESNLLWQHKGRCHHDMFVADDGLIYTLSRHVSDRTSVFVGAGHTTDPPDHVFEDYILILTADGEEVKRLPLIDALLDSKDSRLIRNIKNKADIFHTNTIELLDGRHADTFSPFKKGHLLVSMRDIDTIAVVDPESNQVTWALAGMFGIQHQPTVLDNGNLLLFDNAGEPVHPSNPLVRTSVVVEFDPGTHEIVWSYKGTAESPFLSHAGGSCQRLANGNTLISESMSGRAFEVTAAGEIVWEYFNPHRAGDQDELIAVLWEVERLDWDYAAFSPIREIHAQQTTPLDLGGVDELIDGAKKK